MQAWAALPERVPNVLSRFIPKERTSTGGCTRPSFGITQNFFLEKLVLYQKKYAQAHSLFVQPSFGMTPTQAIRDLFRATQPTLLQELGFNLFNQTSRFVDHHCRDVLHSKKQHIVPKSYIYVILL